jgi:putative selenate reductase
MTRLTPYPFGALVRRVFRELEQRRAVFDLPERRFFLGDERHDLAVRHHDQVAATPFGPAAGPHTQLAPNLVLAWLVGGRILELKTVQVNDRLTIPRPCIDMRTVGYNVEWSQELTLEESLEEYVKAAVLIRLLAASGRLGLAPGMDRTVFDMSLGYDLAGIRSERVQAFVRGMRDATARIDRLRREVPAELGSLGDVDVPAQVSRSVTLSTFHGCPPGEIEAIATFLMRDLGLSCVVKLNPTLLGPHELRALLHDRLGYADVVVPDEAFANDPTWPGAVDLLGRLRGAAASLGVGFGVKLTNTLVVENRGGFLPAGERAAYLSGPPLHVLAMQLVRRVRETFGDAIPVSFSAGIDRGNFADAVALGLVPVTACTDLLKPGGYGRARGYFSELARSMDEAGASTVDAYVLRRREPTPAGRGAADRTAAVLRNTEAYVQALADDPRYAAPQHRRPPRKIGRRLRLFDCLTCDKCIAVCPNDAVFTFPMPSSPELPLVERRQIAVFAEACNDCGNCDVFCPEDGGPYLLKPRLCVTREQWVADAPRDAILIEPGVITGRFDGAEVRVGHDDDPARDDPYQRILRRLRAALLAPPEINHVSSYW